MAKLDAAWVTSWSKADDFRGTKQISFVDTQSLGSGVLHC